jgi:D-proline reductase (dithiol) PrdB
MPEVDSWRFLPKRLARLLAARIPAQFAGEIPWTAVRPGGPRRWRVSLVSTAGLSLAGDTPFDMERERREPMWGDPSYRRIPAAATTADVVANHLHVDTSHISRDLNVALPLDRVRELAAAGELGGVAPTHYSVMGYQLDSTVFEQETAPAIAAAMKKEDVDLAILAPV